MFFKHTLKKEEWNNKQNIDRQWINPKLLDVIDETNVNKIIKHNGNKINNIINLIFVTRKWIVLRENKRNS
jgi:hypothetical protein